MTQERAVATFFDLVRIDSPTFHEARVAEYCADALTCLGFDVAVDGTEKVTGSDTGNLIARLPGTAPGTRIALSAHMDTVEPARGIEPVLGSDGVIRPAGPTILGADDKCGIAAILEALRRIVGRQQPHAAIQVILTVAEEVGLVGAKALDPSLINADLVLVLDADGDVGGIVVAAPTHFTFRAEFHGVAAHAGVSPEKGVSALAMAADAVSAMTLGRFDERSTANIGTITGGVATNVVAPDAVVTGECRSLDAERVEEIRGAMDAAMRQAAAKHGGSVDIAWVREYAGYSVEPDSPGYRLVEASCTDVGLAVRPYATGGGADSNILAEAGVPVVALASGMRAVHSLDEHLRVADLELLVALLEAIIGRAVAEA